MSDAGVTGGRRCPRDGSPLGPMRLDGGFEIDQCPTCAGYWFDPGELARLLETVEDLAFRDPDAMPLAATTAHTCAVDEGVCLVRVPYREASPWAVLRCPYCRGLWVEAATLPVLRKLAAEKPLALVALETEADRSYPNDPDRPECEPLRLRQVAASLPLALGASLVWRLLPFSRFIPGGVRVPLHELGHATVAWFTGHMAVPIPIGLTLSSQDRSVIVCVGLPALCGWRALQRGRAGAYGAALGWGLAGVTQLGLTWGLDLGAHERWLLLGGCGGEFVFAALLVALFHRTMGRQYRWDLARWMALAIGAFVLVDQTLFWRRARADSDYFPWGAAFSDDGDMDRLHDQYGWSENALTGFYLDLATLCFAAAFVVWALALGRAWRAQRARSV